MTLTYETDVRLPADVKAVIISPAIVGDRFVQLAPAYSGGAVLPDNAKLGIDRSEVPVELDEIFKSLDDLAIALGPKGANKDGSLSSLIEDSARQLDGQGQQLNETLTNFAKLSTTLSNNKDELFGSIQEIEQFVALLNRNDSSVRSFFDSTARVSKVLEGERDDLAKTLEFLSKALIDVRRLIKDNRTTLRHNVDNLQSLAEVLARHNEDIEHTLIDAPIALGNLGLAGGSSEDRNAGRSSRSRRSCSASTRSPVTSPESSAACWASPSFRRALCAGAGRPPRRSVSGRAWPPLRQRRRRRDRWSRNAQAGRDAQRLGRPAGGEPMTTFAARARVRLGILATVVAIVVSGCGFSPYKLPLPGGADLGDNPYTSRRSSATCSTSSRRAASASTTSRSARSPTSSSRAGTPSSPCRSTATPACPTTPRRRSGRPAFSVRSSSPSRRPRTVAPAGSATATSSRSNGPAAIPSSRRS